MGTGTVEHPGAMFALNDEEQESAWDRVINEMRSILATDPDALPAIREAVDKQHEDPAETAVVMEMLMGYDSSQLGETPQEIEKGPIGALLTWMNDDDRDIRVLAFRNIRDLTGLGALGQYSPLQDIDRRTKALQSWYKRLDEGTLLKRAG